jgi:hypothetical protein
MTDGALDGQWKTAGGATGAVAPAVFTGRCYAGVEEMLKSEPDRDLRAVQSQLIKEVAVAEVIVIVPITHLGKDITGELAA